MNMEQRYKETFDEIKLSEAKIAEMEVAMRNDNCIKRKLPIKKLVVVIATITLILVSGVVAIASTEIGEEIFNSINDSIKVVTLKLNGKTVNPEKYTDRYGNLILDSFFADDDYNHAMFVDDDGKGNVSVITSKDPTNEIAWPVLVEKSNGVVNFLLQVPKEAELITDIKIEKNELNMWTVISEYKESDYPMYIEFTYEDKPYTVVLSLPEEGSPSYKNYKTHLSYYDLYLPDVSVKAGTAEDNK